MSEEHHDKLLVVALIVFAVIIWIPMIVEFVDWILKWNI